MLTLKTLEEAYHLINTEFQQLNFVSQSLPLLEAKGKILAEDIYATEYVPSFNRSNVDGYALRASDVFGASDSIPTILSVQERIFMGKEANFALNIDCCAAIPTGGPLPANADAVQMFEYTEDYNDNSIGIVKAVAPGQNVTLKGDDVYPGKLLFKSGTVINSKDIGALAALGMVNVQVKNPFTVGIIATGDELVDIDEKPNNAQVRCVNSSLLFSMVSDFGLIPKQYGIIKDDKQLLTDTVEKALQECQVVLISGGSSVGEKDFTYAVIDSLGEIIFHGLAIKPGKPTIMGKALNVPLIGLPGHPVAVFFVTLTIVYNLLEKLYGKKIYVPQIQAILTESVESNHGRAQFVPINLQLQDQEYMAIPIGIKSSLITTLSMANAYFMIPHNCEGYAKGSLVTVNLI